MIAYPRWKIVLVAVVLVIGIFLAVPNLFGEENALQLARDRAAVVDADRTRGGAVAEGQRRDARPARFSSRDA